VSSQEITVRPFQPGDEEGLLVLFNEVFGEDNARHKARTREQWKWEFLDNPAGTQVVVGVEPSGRMVAQYACLPARVNLRGEDVCCGQGIDSVVHRDYRRGLKREGAFLKVARYYFEHFGRKEINAFGYGFPNKKAYRIGVRMLDYVPVAAPVKALYRNLFNYKRDDEVGEGAATEGEILELSRFDERVDLLWERLRPDLKMAIQRTSTYLNWRYSDCPSVNYLSFGLTDESGGLRAVWVTRANWMGPPILAVTELIVGNKDRGAIARALAHCVGLARSTGQPRVELWIPPTSPIYDCVLGQGFQVENSYANLCIKIYDESLGASWARANWFYTIGDSDVF